MRSGAGIKASNQACLARRALRNRELSGKFEVAYALLYVCVRLVKSRHFLCLRAFEATDNLGQTWSNGECCGGRIRDSKSARADSPPPPPRFHLLPYSIRLTNAFLRVYKQARLWAHLTCCPRRRTAYWRQSSRATNTYSIPASRSTTSTLTASCLAGSWYSSGSLLAAPPDRSYLFICGHATSGLGLLDFSYIPSARLNRCSLGCQRA